MSISGLIGKGVSMFGDFFGFEMGDFADTAYEQGLPETENLLMVPRNSNIVARMLGNGFKLAAIQNKMRLQDALKKNKDEDARDQNAELETLSMYRVIRGTSADTNLNNASPNSSQFSLQWTVPLLKSSTYTADAPQYYQPYFQPNTSKDYHPVNMGNWGWFSGQLTQIVQYDNWFVGPLHQAYVLELRKDALGQYIQHPTFVRQRLNQPMNEYPLEPQAVGAMPTKQEYLDYLASLNQGIMGESKMSFDVAMPRYEGFYYCALPPVDKQKVIQDKVHTLFMHSNWPAMEPLAQENIVQERSQVNTSVLYCYMDIDIRAARLGYTMALQQNVYLKTKATQLQGGLGEMLMKKAMIISQIERQMLAKINAEKAQQYRYENVLVIEQANNQIIQFIRLLVSLRQPLGLSTVIPNTGDKDSKIPPLTDMDVYNEKLSTQLKQFASYRQTKDDYEDQINSVTESNMYTYYGHKDDELIGAMELNKKNKTEPINNQSSKNSKKQGGNNSQQYIYADKTEKE